MLRGYASVIAVLGLLSPLLIFGGLSPVIRTLALDDLTRTTRAVAGALTASIASGDLAAADSLARELGADTGARITVIAPDGRVLVDTGADPASMESHRTRTEVIAALDSGEGTAVRTSATLGTEMLYSAVALELADTTAAVVRAGMQFRHIDAIEGGIASRIALLAAIAAILSAMVAWISSRALSAPIGKLAEGLGRMQAGDFGVRAEPSRIRELDDLSRGFNSAAEKTGGLISELSERTSQFEAILDSSSGPLAVLDRSGRFVFANDSFRDLGAMDDFDGKDYREVISRSEMLSVLREALDSTGSGRGRIESGGRTWAASWTEVAGLDQVVIGMADVTESENLAAVKRDFAVNVAHEMRTPLTAIKGFTETLVEHASDVDRKYLGIILRNTDRLISLVRDLQTLAEIENPEYEPAFEEVDLARLTGLVLELFRPAAAAKGLELAFDAGNAGPVRGDAFRLEQVVINLLDNAIKYTDRGSVTVSLSEERNEAVLVIADTGRGIPQADIPRLCERFYVVDKSHSRTIGGTGLGLAIVKHILLLHGGALGIRSEVGRGSTFLVRLPLYREPSTS